jgi:hypothetical protein
VSANLAIEKEKVKVEDEKGTMKKYVDRETGSGKVVERCFCSECGKYVPFSILLPTLVAWQACAMWKQRIMRISCGLVSRLQRVFWSLKFA